MKERIDWIDNAKAIGIFLVVFGHCSNPYLLKNFIFSFHMPLFFFLSGVTFSTAGQIKPFTLKKTKSILIPYLTFGIITYFFWLTIGRHFGTDASLNIEWWIPLLGMLYSNGINNWLVHNTPLWFLPCLFLSEIFLFLLSNKLKSKRLIITLLSISVIGFLFSLTSVPRLPWSFNILPQSLFLLSIGYFLRNKFNFNSKVVRDFGITSVLGIVVFVLSVYNGPVDMNENHYGNYFLFLASAICGIGMIVLISKMIKSNNLIGFIGKNTLVIFTLHGVAISINKGILKFVFGVNLNIFDQNIFLNMLLAIAVITVLLPVCVFINQCAPWLTGRFTNTIK